MTNILINVWYPVEKAGDVYEKFLEVEKIFPMDPNLIKPVFPWGTYATNDGLKGAGIFEVRDDDFEKGIAYFVRRLNKYKNEVDGYTYEIAASADNDKGKTLLSKKLKDFI